MLQVFLTVHSPPLCWQHRADSTLPFEGGITSSLTFHGETVFLNVSSFPWLRIVIKKSDGILDQTSGQTQEDSSPPKFVRKILRLTSLDSLISTHEHNK